MKTIRIYAKEYTTKDNRKFLNFSYVNSRGQFLQVKFKTNCNTRPITKGYHLLTFDEKDISLQKIKDNGVFKPNDIIWVSKVIELKEDIEYTQAKEKAYIEEIENLFD